MTTLPLFPTTLVGSYPQPEWLIDRAKLAGRFPPRVRARELWRPAPEHLAEAQADATLLAVRAQEQAGLDIVTDGEQSRQHFVHGFLEAVAGIDFEHKVKMGIRDNRYEAMVPQVTGPLTLRSRVHRTEATLARAEAAGGRRLWPEVDRFGRARAIYLADPDGNVVELLDGSVADIAAALVKWFPEAAPEPQGERS